MTEKIKNTNPVVELKAQIKQFGFENLRANKDNALANSGKQMYEDFTRQSFIINGKKIDRSLLLLLKGGANNLKFEDCLSEILSKDLTTDTDQKEPKELEDLEHLKFFYDIGKNNAHLLPKNSFAMEVFNDLNRMSSEKYGDLLQRYEKTKDKNDDYCPFVKEFFKEMFQYAGAEVPHDSILEELTTNCNQAGYVGSLVGGTDKPLGKITQNHGFSFDVEKNKTIHINCDNENCVILKVDEHINICDISKPAEVVEGKIAHSLEFKLESQNDKKDVTYKDGKLLLIVPNELKNYTIGEKKLFDVIKEYFEAFCRKLGFNFEIKIEHNFTKPPLTRTNPVEQVEPSNKNQERTTPLG